MNAAQFETLLVQALHADNAAKTAQRAADRGTADKLNPWVTDAGKCIRQVGLSLRNVPQSDPLTTDSLINFGVGHAVESWLASLLTSHGLEIQREVKVAIEHQGVNVTGRADLLAVGADLLLEIKSTSSRALGYTRKDGGKDDHKAQINLYLRHYAKPNGVLLYVAKDAIKGENPLFAVDVPYNAREADADLDSLAELARTAQAGLPPPAIPDGLTKSKFPCSYCSYKTYCWR